MSGNRREHVGRSRETEKVWASNSGTLRQVPAGSGRASLASRRTATSLRADTAPAEGAERHRFQLILLLQSVQEGNVLKVRVAEDAPAEGLFLWMPGRPPGLLEKSLLESLSRIDCFDLVNRFAEGRTDPLPPDPGTGLGMAGTLNAEQSHARASCRSPGVHLGADRQGQARPG